MDNKPLSIKEHQEIMLKMMIEFDKFCQEKKLRYFLAYGTLLGAVRHKGFIPWDDDVDLFMPRPDYEKLLTYSEVSKNTEIVSIKNDHGYYHPLPYCNLADKTTIMKEDLIKKQTGKGVFCDIFPLDGVPNKKYKRIRFFRKLSIYQTLVSNGFMVEAGCNNLKNTIKTILSKMISEKSLFRYAQKLDKLAQKYDYESSEYVLPCVAFDKRPYKYLNDKKSYDNYILLDFEGYKLRAPLNYDEILKQAYGDYMQLPPESERSGHHGIEIYKR